MSNRHSVVQPKITQLFPKSTPIVSHIKSVQSKDLASRVLLDKICVHLYHSIHFRFSFVFLSPYTGCLARPFHAYTLPPRCQRRACTAHCVMLRLLKLSTADHPSAIACPMRFDDDGLHRSTISIIARIVPGRCTRRSTHRQIGAKALYGGIAFASGY